ncbi:putative transcription factor AS2-LOB family [Dioscorea sansibarensis]
MTLKGGTSQACAACKYQRRKCTSDCPLAPYFPPDMPKQFQNAHKLFGVSNILKILNKLDPSRRPEAMKTIIYEANIRDRSPVHGCLGIIYAIHFQIHQAQLELDALNQHLSMLQRHAATASSSAASNDDYMAFDNAVSLAPISNACNIKSVLHDYDEISPFFDALVQDDQQSFIDSRELNSVSSGEKMAGDQQGEHMTENELKNAAACFTLTSIMN